MKKTNSSCFLCGKNNAHLTGSVNGKDEKVHGSCHNNYLKKKLRTYHLRKENEVYESDNHPWNYY